MVVPKNALDRVEADMANTERRIAEQKQRIARLRADGYDTTASESRSGEFGFLFRGLQRGA